METSASTSLINGYKCPVDFADRPAWVQVLYDCKYPDDVVVIDFETYFTENEYSLKDISTIEYVMDERFEVLGVAILQMDGSRPFANHEQASYFWSKEDGALARIQALQDDYGPNLEKCTVVIQNAMFDATILSRTYGIYPPFVIDTAGLARHLYPRQKVNLKLLCQMYELTAKGDTAEFSGCSFKPRWMKPGGRGKNKRPIQVPPMSDEKAVALAKYAANDASREWELFTIMLPRLSNPKTELPLMQHTLELFTKPVLEIDYAKAEELVQAMTAEMEKTIPPDLDREEISGNTSFDRLLSAALAEAGDNSPEYWKPNVKGKMILAIAKTDEAREVLVNHPSGRVRQLMEARIALKSWPNHIGRITSMVNMAKVDGDQLPIPLKYHGAHTGRWSGDEGINPQNLGTKSHPLVNAIRGIIVAPPGHKLVIVDEAAIEARVLAALAGQDDLVEKFKNGEEIYCGFASKVLGIPVRKPRKSGGIPTIEQRMGWARNSVGKVGILGCGYGMGADKAVGYAGGAIDLPTAQRIVDQYRKDNAKIVKFWRDIESAFKHVVKHGSACQLGDWLRFRGDSSCHATITLPNGRCLYYRTVKLEGDRGYEHIDVWNELIHKWEHVWGGHLTENVVQAISRDTLAEALLRVEQRGYHVALHIHDELVACVPEDEAEEALAVMIEELCRVPDWMPVLPLAAEGVISNAYGKH